MKKLTKRVQAGGLWFDVPANINYVAFSHTGDVYCYLREPPKPVTDWKKSMFQPCGLVSLDGADWRECCWYVGDQAGGEAVERREWMARGCEMAITNAFDTVPSTRLQMTSRLCAYAAKIRSGEIE